MQGVRVLYVDFGEVIFVFGGVDVETAVGDEAAFVERVLIRVPQGDKFVVPPKCTMPLNNSNLKLHLTFETK